MKDLTAGTTVSFDVTGKYIGGVTHASLRLPGQPTTGIVVGTIDYAKSEYGTVFVNVLHDNSEHTQYKLRFNELIGI